MKRARKISSRIEIIPLEPLEPRMHLSSSSSIVVRGTNDRDTVTMGIHLARDGSKQLQVNINGIERNYDLTGVRQIELDTLNGDDQVTVDRNTVRGIIINGGLGNDLIVGGDGADTLIGGRGNDTLIGGDGDNYLKGSDGDDSLTANSGNDHLEGGRGNDTLSAGNGNNTLVGGAGTDEMFSGRGNSTFFSRDGERDTLAGGSGNNRGQTDLDDILGGIQTELP